MTHFNGPSALITLDVPTSGVLSISVETDLYSAWKEWLIGRYFFDTELDVNGATDAITYVDHSMHTGQEVVYWTDNGGGAENIGLVDGTSYYVRADDASGDRDTFTLYDTEFNAENSPSVVGRMDLTASGLAAGEIHRISADNSKFLAAFRTIGGDNLTPGVDAGPYFFIQNGLLTDAPPQGGWRIISTDEDQTVNYQGNLVAEQPDTTLINVTPGRSVLHLGLQPITQRVDELLTTQQTAVFAGVVWIDTLGGGTAGTDYPIGTASVPADNLADGLTIAAANNFKEFKLRGPITFSQDPGLTVWTGHGSQAEILFGGRDISGTEFKDLIVSGTIATPTAHILMIGCEVNGIAGFSGDMWNCLLDNTIVLDNFQESRFINCTSNIAGAASPIIDGNNLTGLDVAIRGYNGGIRLANFTQSDTVMTVGMNTGKVNISASCTDFSDVQVRGVATLNNESALAAGIGKILNTESLLDATDVLLIRQMTAGNATVSVDDLTVTVYDEDTVTVLATFSLSADGRIRTRTS